MLKSDVLKHEWYSLYKKYIDAPLLGDGRDNERMTSEDIAEGSIVMKIFENENENNL